MEMSALATGLEYRNGIWYAAHASRVSYPTHGNEECYHIEKNSFWFGHRNAVLTAALKNFPPPGAIFDIGGGNGYQARALTQNSFETVLVEPGEQAVRNAQTNGVKNVICATLADAHFLPNALPALGSFDVLEHIQEDDHFLQQLYTVLQPGGRLYLTAPAYQWLWSAEDQRAGHFRRYTLRELQHKLAVAGFTIEFASYFFSLLPWPIFFCRSLPSRWHRPSPTITAQTTLRQHRPIHGIVGHMIERLLQWETRWLAARRRLPFGSSCLIVAKKMA